MRRPGGCGGPACCSPSSPRLGGGRPACSTGEVKLEPPPGLLPRRQQQKQNCRAALTGRLPTGFSPSSSLHPSRVTAPWQPYKPLLSSLGKRQQWVWEPEAVPLSPAAAGTSGFSDPGLEALSASFAPTAQPYFRVHSRRLTRSAGCRESQTFPCTHTPVSGPEKHYHSSFPLRKGGHFAF